MQILKNHSIDAEAEMNLKTIAEQNQTNPMDVYHMIWEDLNTSQNNQ